MKVSDGLILAVPKGRLLTQLLPLMARAGIEPELDFHNEKTRRLSFKTNMESLTLIRVRSFDVATFVAFGGAHLGVTGHDTLLEFDYPEIYAPLDLRIGRCRLSLAESVELAAEDDPSRWSHVRIATKYPQATRRYFAMRGVHAECVKLTGAVELAPSLVFPRPIPPGSHLEPGTLEPGTALAPVTRIATLSGPRTEFRRGPHVGTVNLN